VQAEGIGFWKAEANKEKKSCCAAKKEKAA
jgi:hypothetical protein